MDGLHVRGKRHIHEQGATPVSERGADQVIKESKTPARITPPKDSLKKIEKNLVKRQTQLFESGGENLDNPGVTNDGSYHCDDGDDRSNLSRTRQSDSPSPYQYKPSGKQLNNQVAQGHISAYPYQPTNQQDRLNANKSDFSDSTSSPYAYKPSAQISTSNNHNVSPYQYKPSSQSTNVSSGNKPKLDVSISKAIGEQAKALIEKRKHDSVAENTNQTTRPPPERPKVPPSPGTTREKPKYPYSPSVETELDHKKAEPKQKYSPAQPTAKSNNLYVNTSSQGPSSPNDAKKSPKTPSPPVRPPLPKPHLNKPASDDKHVSTLIANKTKVFESGNKTVDETINNRQSVVPKPHVRLKPSISIDKSTGEIVKRDVLDNENKPAIAGTKPNVSPVSDNKPAILGTKPKVPGPTYQQKRNSGPDQEKQNSSLVTTNKTDNNTNLPDYAQINKDKKVKDRLAIFEGVSNNNVEGGAKPKIINPKPAERLVSSSNDNFKFSQLNEDPGVQSSSNTTPPPPPAKPPRTFAYDEELKKKRDKREKKIKSREMPLSPLVTADHKYEDISETSSGTNFKPGGVNRSPKRFEVTNSKITNSEVHLYEDISQEPFESPNNHNSVAKSKSHDSILRKKTYTYDKLDEDAASMSQYTPHKSAYVRKKPHTYEELDENLMPVQAANKPSPPRRPVTSVFHNPSSVKQAHSGTPKPQDDSRWDKGFVRIKNPNLDLKKKPIIAKKAVANPGYELHHEFIPIKTVYMQDGSLKRYKSEESLYTGQTGHVDSNGHQEEPLYHDPADVVKAGYSHINQHGVSIDAEGYAVPELNSTLGGNTKGRYIKHHTGVKRRGTMAFDKSPTNTHNRQSKRLSKSSLQSHASIKEKLNEAYSVLRKRQLGEDSQPQGLTEDTEDSDSDMDQDDQQKRLEYISTTKLRLKDHNYSSIYEKAMFCSSRSPEIQLMFDYALIVGLENIPDTNQYIPKVIYSFPHQKTPRKKDSPELPIIASFCFPDANVWRPVSQYRTETFSFVLTASDGSRQYGYCRRFLPPDPKNANTNRLPEVYCIISSLKGWSFYGQLLEHLQNKRKISLHLAQELLSAAYGRPLPPIGQDAWICSFDENDEKDTVIINRSADDRMDKVCETLLDHLPVDKLLKVFSALLLERKLLFVAQHLGTLTDCIHGLVSLLYPFTWQHTFIPILPGDLLDVIEAPTPFVLGVLATHYAQIQERDISEVMIIDLDNKCILRCLDDEDRIIPKKLQKALKSALKEDSVPKETKNMLVTEAFLRMFVETVGHYTNYVNTQQDGCKEFQREMFVRAVSSKSINMYLEWFSETQMFEIFITERLENPDLPEGLFEVRLEEYQEEMSRYHPTVKQNIKDAGKKMISFLIESGGKIKKVFV